jgi:large subunit ribosomal protein L17
VIKEVQVVKQYDMKELMAMLKGAATKTGARKVVGETTTTGKAKEVDRYVVGTRDDLTKIEGIGPKIAEILKAGKIMTYAKLADTKPAKISALLDAAGPRFQMHDPGSWPRQAKLAAAGKWKELEKLQDELDGGK